MKVDFLEKKSDGKVIFTGSYMEIYVPEYFMSSGITQYEGDAIQTFFLLNYRYTKDPNVTDLSKEHLGTMSIPSEVVTKPSDTAKKNMQLGKNTKPENYTIMKYYHGDIVLMSLDVIQRVENVELYFMKLLSGAKIPSTVPYTEVCKQWLRCYEMNKINPGVSLSALGIFCSEVLRDPKDPTRSYRFVAGEGNYDKTGYIAVNSRGITANTSTFSGLTSEDTNNKIVVAVNNTRYKRRESKSPIEKLIKNV